VPLLVRTGFQAIAKKKEPKKKKKRRGKTGEEKGGTGEARIGELNKVIRDQIVRCK
jgi:hypothetical protein